MNPIKRLLFSILSEQQYLRLLHRGFYILLDLGLLKGNLVAEDYEDDVAKDPRIDALREKMVINEDKRYSKEY